MESLLCEMCKKPTFMCECNYWKKFNEIVLTCCGNTTNDVVYTSLSISTMTICFNFNQFVNLQLLKDNLPDFLSVNYKPGSKKSKEKKKKGTDSFYNSFDIKICFVDRLAEPMVFSNVSIFIFPNGKVKLAGIRTTNTINIVIQELIETIKSVEGVITDHETFAAENIKVQMICSDFEIKPLKENQDGWCIRQEDLKNILVNTKHSATFSSLSRYPGINLKVPSVIEKDKEVSLLIFRSAKIIITGAKYAEDLCNAYKFIIETIIRHKDTIFYFDIGEEIKQKKKKKSIL